MAREIEGREEAPRSDEWREEVATGMRTAVLNVVASGIKVTDICLRHRSCGLVVLTSGSWKT